MTERGSRESPFHQLPLIDLAAHSRNKVEKQRTSWSTAAVECNQPVARSRALPVKIHN